MNTLLTKIKNVLARIRAYFPSTLPQGVTECHKWCDEIIQMAGLPNNDSVRFALCVKILHLGETECNKAKEYFVRALKKAAANQVVSQIINDLKAKQEVEQLAAKAATAAPVTDIPVPNA